MMLIMTFFSRRSSAFIVGLCGLIVALCGTEYGLPIQARISDMQMAMTGVSLVQKSTLLSRSNGNSNDGGEDVDDDARLTSTAQVKEAVTAAMKDLQGGIKAEIQQSVKTAMAGFRTKIKDDLNAAIGGAKDDKTIDASVKAGVKQMAEKVSGAVSAKVPADLGGKLKTLEGKVATVNSATGKLGAAVAKSGKDGKKRDYVIYKQAKKNTGGIGKIIKDMKKR